MLPVCAFRGALEDVHLAIRGAWLTDSSQKISGLNLAGKLRFLLRDATLYGVAGAISKAFALITFPLLARHFSVQEYGVLDYFLVLAGLLAIVFVFGQDSAVARYFYEHESRDDRQQLISQSLVFQLGGVVLLLPILWLSAGWVTGLLIDAADRVLLYKIILVQLPFLLLINFSQNLLKWTFARARFLMMSLGYTVVHASLLVVAVLVFDVGVVGVLAVSLATSFLFGLLGLFFVREWLVRPRDFGRLREMLPFAAPYGVICVVGSFSPVLERTLTDSLLGVESLGLYAAASKLAMLMSLFVSAFQIAWGPFSLSLYKQADSGQTYNWVFKIFTLTVCLAALLLALLAPPLLTFLATDRYIGALVVVFPLAMGLAIQATGWVSELGITISKRAYLNLYAYAVSVLLTLGAILLFTPALGLLGVGLGVLVGQIAKAVVASWLAQRAYPLPWAYKPVIIVIIATLIGGLLSNWALQQFGVWIGSIFYIASICLVVSLGWLILLTQDERVRVGALLSQVRTRG